MNILKAIIHIHEIKESLKRKKAESRKNFAKKSQDNLDLVLKKFDTVLASNQLALLGTIFVFVISILVRSTRDIGYESAATIDLTNILATNHQNFSFLIGNVSPLTFYLGLIPYFFSEILAINIIISHFVFNNLLGILAIFFSAKILTKSQIKKDHFNLIILSFAVGYFWRIFNLNFNEFDTQTSYFLILVFPYISYQLIAKENLKKFDQLIIIILASLIICLKFNYVFLVITFEFLRLIKQKSLSPAFIYRNISTTILVSIFFSYFDISPNYHNAKYLIFYLFNIKEHISLVILLYLIFSQKIKEDPVIKFLVILSLSTILLILGSKPKDLDQISLFYSLSLPAMLLIAVNFIKSKQINIIENWFYVIPFIFLPLLSQQQFAQIILQIPNLWWVLSIFVALKYRKKSAKINIESFWPKIVIPLNFKYLLAFLLVLTTLYIFSNFAISSSLLWLINIYFFYLLVIHDHKIHRQLKNKKSNKLYILTIIAIFTHIIGLIAQGITLNDSQNLANKFKSPNFVSEQIIKNIKNYSPNAKATIIGDNICDQYPITKYFANQNNIQNTGYGLLYNQIELGKNGDEGFLNKIAQDELDRLINNIKNQSQVIIIKNYDDNFRRNCEIGFLEFYLRNDEFRKIFINNYQFANRILEYQKQEAEITIEEKSLLQQELDRDNYNRLIKDYEVYERNNFKK